jgi:hypothetical protein
VVLTNHNIKTFARSVVEVDESICRLVRNLSIQLDPVLPKTPWDGGWDCPFSGVKYCPTRGTAVALDLLERYKCGTAKSIKRLLGAL